jgi:hypothetical protein
MQLCPLCNSRLIMVGAREDAEIDTANNQIIQKLYRDQTCPCKSNPDNEFLPCPNHGKILDTVITETKVPLVNNLKTVAEQVVLEQFTGDEAMVLASKLADKAVQDG